MIDEIIPNNIKELIDRNRTRFLISTKLADGATAIVYNSKLADQNVAIKIFIKGAVPPENIQREIEVLKREGSLITTISPKKSDNFESIGIVSPLFSGKTLRELLQTNLSMEMKNNIAISLLKELYALQLLNIVHRDLKPENILVDENGIAKIIDFGEAQSKTLNHKDDILAAGLNYLAPECTSKPHPTMCNALTDEYAMGIILAELYSDKNYTQEAHTKPLGQNAPYQIMDDILGKNATPKKEMPEEIFHIIRHLSEPDPQRQRRAENVALAKGTNKFFPLKTLYQIQESANDLRQILLEKTIRNQSPEDVQNILRNHEDLSTIRNQLQQIKKKPNNVQEMIREIDNFGEKHARQIQHKNIIIAQGIELTIQTIIELEKLEAKYKPHKIRERKTLRFSSKTDGSENPFTHTIKLIRHANYPNVDLKYVTQLLDQLSVNTTNLNIKEENFSALLSLRDKIQNLQSINHMIPQLHSKIKFQSY